MKKLFIFLLALGLVCQWNVACAAGAAGVAAEELATGVKLLSQDSKAAEKAALGSSKGGKTTLGGSKDISGSGYPKLNPPTALNKRAAELKQQEAIHNDFLKLQAKASALKEKNPTYNPPWTPAANRFDWQARDTILRANKPLTVAELATRMFSTPAQVENMLLKDQSNSRKVFFKLGDGRWWVSSSKIP